MPLTTRGEALKNRWSFRGENRPTTFYIAMVTAATAPTAATKTLSELTEIAAGNGYTAGGYALTPGSTDFPTISEDDTNVIVEMAVKTVAWTAGGGDIPSSGDPARYTVMTDDHATLGSRQIIWYQSLGANRIINSGNSMQLARIMTRVRGGSMIKSRQAGTITLTNGVASNTATITAVDTTKCDLSDLGHTIASQQGNNDDLVRLALTNSTTVTATRIGTDADVIIGYQVLEYF